MTDLQLDENGRLRHFLSIDGLKPKLLTELLDTAESFRSAAESGVRKLPLLRGKTVINLFFEPSTRTRTTFELAARRLSADVINIDVVIKLPKCVNRPAVTLIYFGQFFEQSRVIGLMFSSCFKNLYGGCNVIGP